MSSSKPRTTSDALIPSSMDSVGIIDDLEDIIEEQEEEGRENDDSDESSLEPADVFKSRTSIANSDQALSEPSSGDRRNSDSVSLDDDLGNSSNFDESDAYKYEDSRFDESRYTDDSRFEDSRFEDSRFYESSFDFDHTESGDFSLQSSSEFPASSSHYDSTSGDGFSMEEDERSSMTSSESFRRKSVMVPGTFLQSSDASVNSDISGQGSFSQREQSWRQRKRNSLSIPGISTTESSSPTLHRKRPALLSARSRRYLSAEPLSETHSALTKLDNASTEFERVLAAAAVVAAGTAGKHQRRYRLNDRVLVFLNILTHTSTVQDDERTTTNPVNKHGYPEGKGKTPEESRGPFVFVLATVTMIHYEENAIYYTVKRADTGAEQRAEADWMEPIPTYKGELAAYTAAKQSIKSSLEDNSNTASAREKGIDSWNTVCRVFTWPCRFVYRTIRKSRQGYGLWSEAAKFEVQRILYGDSPYACRLRVTGINLLVFCSFIFMFIDQAALAYLPPSFDFPMTLLSLIIWIILALELLGECFIRPEGYSLLVDSEKAFAPSTTRFLNSFHLVMETIALLFFFPNFQCLYRGECGDGHAFNTIDSSVKSVVGPSRLDVVIGELYFATVRLRIIGLVRHWKKMWINDTFVQTSEKTEFGSPALDEKLLKSLPRRKAGKEEDDPDEASEPETETEGRQDDNGLKKAANIGTALMVINSHRAMMLLVAIFGLMPLIATLAPNGGANLTAKHMTESLQAINLMTKNATDENCAFLEESVQSWFLTNLEVPTRYPIDNGEGTDAYILWVQLLPVRCPFQNGTGGIVTQCPNGTNYALCDVWEDAPSNADVGYFVDALDMRRGAIVDEYRSERASYNDSDGIVQDDVFSVTAYFNHVHSVGFVNFASVLLQLVFLILTLIGLTVLRNDAGRLVLDPLSRMLKIVLRYASDPLKATPRPKKKKKKNSTPSGDGSQDEREDSDFDAEKDQLGNYETVQLINAITKITDLLRKCWGVAGAGIISSNLARTQDGATVVFNPTVPGRLVYALFSFVSINKFSSHLRALDQDVMILINDVAKVVHDEVFRWGFGDSGQCNKNLGSAFLMVFRIGDFQQVQSNLARATDVIFQKRSTRKASSVVSSSGTSLRRRYQSKGNKLSRGYGRQSSGGKSGLGKRTGQKSMSSRSSRQNSGSDFSRDLQLSSLPGISAFADRALIGMLKSFAGVCRDKDLQNWKKDFRLGAGVGAFSVDIIIGMDAGWAVEGAVGSEYKIDATYLSPHVNMAARMMTATNQFGVSILFSQAVEVLLSGPARKKMRHLDTVYVKGSNQKQKVYTYDARKRGVDFFLMAKSNEQADLDSERYSPKIWETDQDLLSMRKHVSEEFEEAYRLGRKDYFAGNWKMAVKRLKAADNHMITRVVEEGYLDYDVEEFGERLLDDKETDRDIVRLRQEIGDGASKCLIAYMVKEGGEPPSGWQGVRKLTLK